MVRLRALFIWLVVLALPLQGLAAVTMVLCTGGASHHAAAAAPADAPSASAGHDHSQHDHSSADAKPLNHKCGICAACCHSIALSSSPPAVSAQPLPAADLLEPFVVIHAVSPQALERPPRA